MSIRLLMICLLMTVVNMVQAQTTADRKFLREGNRVYRLQQYDKAEVQYRKALSANPGNPQALYNLGCALMMQNKDSAAVVMYEKAADVETNKMRLSKIYHNIGVICQNKQMYSEAINAYQQSLRNNPHDDETRYNLALCKRMQKKQNKKNQNQQQQNQDKDKNGENKKEEQNKNNPDKKKNDKKQNPEEKMSKENAEQMLNAAMQEEKATQQKLKSKMQQQQSRKLQNNW